MRHEFLPCACGLWSLLPLLSVCEPDLGGDSRLALFLLWCWFSVSAASCFWRVGYFVELSSLQKYEYKLNLYNKLQINNLHPTKLTTQQPTNLYLTIHFTTHPTSYQTVHPFSGPTSHNISNSSSWKLQVHKLPQVQISQFGKHKMEEQCGKDDHQLVPWTSPEISSS